MTPHSTFRPRRLSAGQTIGVVAPAGPVNRSNLEKGARYLEKCGYRVKFGAHVFEQTGYLAGSDAHRAEDLNFLFADNEVRAIFCARGGYGTPRILEHIDYHHIRKNPKIFVGYSDITALQLAILKEAGVVTFSGPMVAVQMAKGMDPFTEESLWATLTSDTIGFKFRGQKGPLRQLKSGKAKGRFLGGCLSLVCALLGTPYTPDFDGAILFLEDVGEEPYRIDRQLTQLRLSGVFERINGLVFGDFSSCKAENSHESFTIGEVIDNVIADLKIPAVADLPYGHTDLQYTIPIGIEVLLDADAGYLELLQSPVT